MIFRNLSSRTTAFSIQTDVSLTSVHLVQTKKQALPWFSVFFSSKTTEKFLSNDSSKLACQKNEQIVEESQKSWSFSTMEAVPKLSMLHFDLKYSPENTDFLLKLKRLIHVSFNWRLLISLFRLVIF
jgi:hypothetical protein